MSYVGRKFRSEKSFYVDEKTEVRICKFTDQKCVHHHLYFTNPSWSPDCHKLFFVSYRSGYPNLFCAEYESGEITQVTDIPDLNPFSAAISIDGNEVFFTAGIRVCSVRLQSYRVSTLARFPQASLFNCNVSPDGSLVGISIRERSGCGLGLVNSDGSGHEIILKAPEIGHVQFCPGDTDTLMYSGGIHERIWLINADGSRNRLLYEQDPREWITHESWLGRGDEVIFTHWPKALRSINRDGKGLRTIVNLNCWHSSSRRDGDLIVCDTNHPARGLLLIDSETGDHRTLCHPKSSNKGTQWLFDRPFQGKVGAIDTSMLRGSEEKPPTRGPCTSESIYGPQWTHPHPSFSPDGKKIVYTSDRDGYSQIYVVEVPRSL